MTGLDTTVYEIDSVRELEVEGAPVTIVNVILTCDLNDTPWCMTPQQIDEVCRRDASTPVILFIVEAEIRFDFSPI